MNISIKKLPESCVSIHITLDWEEWSGEINHAVTHVAKAAKIQGFRPGKAPRDIIEKRYGKESVLHEAAEHAVSKAYAKALKQERVDALGKPDVKLDGVAEGQPLSFTIVTAIMPEVTLADWKDAVQAANVKHATKIATLVVDPQEIEDELRRLAVMRAKFITVNRAAALEDSVEIDFEVRQNGVIIEGGKSDKHPLVLGKGAFIPGFEEAIVGMRAGEENTFTLSFPAEYHAKHLAGKPAEFLVRMRLVQERQIPAIDDTFAKSLGSFETLQDFKSKLAEGILEEKRHLLKEEGRSALLDALVERSSAELPILLVEEQLQRMMAEFQSQIERLGMSLEQYLERVGKPLDDLKRGWDEQARKRIQAELILEKLALENHMEVDTQEIEAAMNQTLVRFKQIKDAKQDIDLERLYAATRSRLLNERVFEMLESVG